MLREKLLDLHVASAAATRAGWIENAHEIVGDMDTELRALIDHG